MGTRTSISTFLLAVGITTSALAAGPIVRATEKIPNEYIVVVTSEGASEIRTIAAEVLAGFRGVPISTFDGGPIPAFVISMTETQALAVAAHPRVAWVEENAIFRFATESPQATPDTPLPGHPDPNTPASLAYLDRLDQVSPGSSRFNGSFSFCSTGTGVRVYVMDGGVHPTHPEFEGRVDPAPGLQSAFNAKGMGLGDYCWVTGNPTANVGHGTAVASLVGGMTFGVAKGVTIVDARTANCLGQFTSARILEALTWIKNDSTGGSARKIINMSFSALNYADSGFSAVRAAIDSLVDQDNIIVVAAAGNKHEDVYWYTPASALRAITVGSSDKLSDARSYWSNYGQRVSFYAPSQFIEAAHVNYVGGRWQYRSEATGCFGTGDTDSCVSGTSFAAPLVAGAVARYLEMYPLATRDGAVNYLNSEASQHNGVLVTDPTLVQRRVLSIVDCN